MEARLVHDSDSRNSVASFSSAAHSESIYRLRLMAEPPSSINAVVAACVAGIGPFVFGYSLGFTSPVLTAMCLLKDDGVFKDSTLQQVANIP